MQDEYSIATRNNLDIWLLKKKKSFVLWNFFVIIIFYSNFIISSVLFAVGVSLSGINIMPAGERFWLLLLGGLWGKFGAAILFVILTKNRSKAITTLEEVEGAGAIQYLSSFIHSINQIFNLLLNNMSLRSGHLQFSISFAITGAIGLLIAHGLGLLRGYWVLITICVLLLR